MENFPPQGMERHQIMMNTIMNRASVREIMLQHEKTFKEQVHDLHKLYQVQRLLMEKATSRGVDGYPGGPPPPPPPPRGCGNGLSEETNQLGQRINFWEQITPDSMGGVKGAMATHHLPSTEKAFPEKNSKLEDTSNNSRSPVRKRKIDLEQLPEDDSDDEIETSVDALNSSLSGNSREFTHGRSGPESMIKSHPSPCPGTGLKPLHPVKESQANSLLTGESSLYKNHIDGSGRGSFYPFQHGKAPSLPVNIVKAEQNLSNIGEINTSFQNACMINTGVGTIKSNTMFLPQADLIDRASQEAGREAHWFFQADSANRSSKSPLQQQQRLSPHVALPELLTGRSHPHNGVLQGSPNLEQRHHNNQSPPLGNVSVGDWSKAPAVEKQPPGLLVGAQKDRPFSSSERLGDASRWLTKEPFSQSPLGSVVPMARIETRASEGGPAMPSIVAPVVTVSSSQGLSQERDLNMWSSQNPILQHPQYQQPPIFQPQVFPSVNQAVWLQPSQTTQNSMYSQQMVYGVHSSDSLGYRNESLQRNQSELAGPWNMIGLGHYYSSVPSTPQKPPFKKPPKLILKNDGVGMELKLVSPEKEMSEKASQKKPSNSFKKDSPQDVSKYLEKKSAVQKEVKDEDQKRASLGVQLSSSVGQGREPSKTSGVPLEPKLLATATSSLTQEIILPKESSLLHDATATVALSSITQSNVGTTRSVFAAGLIVSASPDKHKSQHNVSQAENVLPTQGHEKQYFPSPESTKAACVNETPPVTDRGIDTDMPDQKAESSLLQCKDDIGSGHRIMRDQKALSAKVLTSEANAKDMVATSQPESSSVAPEDAPSKTCEESVLAANTSQQRLQKFDANHCKEAERPKGSHSTPCASADSPSKDASHFKGLFQGRFVGQSADLANPLCQPTMQAVSIQSNTPATPPSDRDCSSARSSTSLIPESKPESKAVVSSDDLHLDFDSDNLAASILLSFAPKIDIPNEEKHAKGDACAISSSSRKDRPADQASSSSRKDRPTDQASSKTSQGATGLRTQTLNSGGSQGRRMQGQGSFKRTDRMRHHEPIKSTMKDRLRTDERNIDELEMDNGGEDTIKSLTIKLPRVMGTMNGEAIPISRSKQLSKLNGVGDLGDRTKTFKANDTFHTPTGRRSSRGPPMAARILHESGSRLQQQTRHRLEGSSNTPEKDSGSREEAAGIRNKAEGNKKSKAWGELNKTRSHPRKQFQETSHRKTQR